MGLYAVFDVGSQGVGFVALFLYPRQRMHPAVRCAGGGVVGFCLSFHASSTLGGLSTFPSSMMGLVRSRLMVHQWGFI